MSEQTPEKIADRLHKYHDCLNLELDARTCFCWLDILATIATERARAEKAEARATKAHADFQEAVRTACDWKNKYEQAQREAAKAKDTCKRYVDSGLAVGLINVAGYLSPEEVERVRLETIEKCADLVRAYGTHHQSWEATRAGIADAIRALKEKP